MIKIRLLLDFTNRLYPGLKKDLYISNMDKSPEQFVTLTLLLTIVMSTIFMIPIAWIISMLVPDFMLFLSIASAVLIFLACFFLILHVPYFNMMRMGKRIEGEIAVTGRRLLIQIESGKSLANSIIDVAKHKKESSKSLEKVAYELYMGKPLERAIKEAIENTPSPTFRKIFIQIKNSLRTGADMKNTLKASLENITRQKIVEFETFGKKLNTLGLFYMVFGTIAPSLGIVVFAIILTVLGIPIKMGVLSFFLAFILFIQVVFVYIFSKMRPELEI